MTARHRVLIIGAGSIGERHIRCFLATGRVDVAFVELRPDLREQIATRYPQSRGFSELEAALEAGLDAAVIATPAPLHVAQATQLATRGIHLLIEKPLSVTTEGIDSLQAAVAERRIVAAVAYVYRAHPALTEMRQAIQSGAFGRPVELVMVSGQHFPFYRPAYRSTYYTRHASGGGAVQDALTHGINAAEWLIGPTDRLVADVAHQVLDGTDVEDTAHVLARHGDILASYSLNQHQAPNELTLTVVCEKGTARFEYHRNRWRTMLRPGEEWINRAAIELERDTLFTRQASAFLDAIEGTAPPACTLDEGLQTLRVNLGILQSARVGSWISIRPEPVSSLGAR